MCTTLLLILLGGIQGVSNAEGNTGDIERWNVRFLRIEGAAVSLRTAADHAYEISEKISVSKHLSNLGPLRSAAEELRRVVRSAELAVAVAASDIDAN